MFHHSNTNQLNPHDEGNKTRCEDAKRQKSQTELSPFGFLKIAVCCIGGSEKLRGNCNLC